MSKLMPETLLLTISLPLLSVASVAGKPCAAKISATSPRVTPYAPIGLAEAGVAANSAIASAAAMLTCFIGTPPL